MNLDIYYSAGEKEKGYVYPQHHPKAEFDEDVLPIGAAVYAQLGMINEEWEIMEVFCGAKNRNNCFWNLPSVVAKKQVFEVSDGKTL